MPITTVYQSGSDNKRMDGQFSTERTARSAKITTTRVGVSSDEEYKTWLSWLTPDVASWLLNDKKIQIKSKISRRRRVLIKKVRM